MKRLCYFAAALGLVLGIGSVLAQADAPQPAPKSHLAILNGVSPGPVDIYLGGKLLYPDIPPGQRISTFGWSSEKLDIRVVDKKTGGELKEQFQLPPGGYSTLYLFGDFAPLPKPENAKLTDPPPVRGFAQLLNNKLEAGDASLRVRLINGLVDTPITVKFPKGNKSWIVQPLQTVVATGLPADLYLDAFMGEVKRGLYLAQAGDPRNLSIVFYPKNGAFGFRAMPEDIPPAP